jgi:hypothetical protein
MDKSGLGLKRRQIEKRYECSEAAFLLETFNGGSAEICINIFAIADQHSNP